VVILVVGLQFFRMGVGADLKGRAQTSVDAAALAGAGTTRDFLVAQLLLRGASTGPWAAYGGQGVGCPAATAFALKNSKGRLVRCDYDPRAGTFSARVHSLPKPAVGVAKTRAVATVNLPRCQSHRYTDGATHYITRVCTGNGRSASATWKVETQTLITPPDVLAWRQIFRIRLVDEGSRPPLRGAGVLAARPLDTVGGSPWSVAGAVIMSGATWVRSPWRRPSRSAW